LYQKLPSFCFVVSQRTDQRRSGDSLLRDIGKFVPAQNEPATTERYMPSAFILPNVIGEPHDRLARSVLLGARSVTAGRVGSSAWLGFFPGHVENGDHRSIRCLAVTDNTPAFRSISTIHDTSTIPPSS